MSYEINEVVIIDGSRNIVNAGVGTFAKVHATGLEVGSSTIADILDEDNLVSNSATALVTQQSVKTYIDNSDSALSNRLDTLELDPTTQSLLDAEALARGNADTALSDRLDTLELDPTTATAVASVQTDVDNNETAQGLVNADFATLSGVALGSTTLGTFTGSTISDDSTIKAALQDLESGVDNALGGGAAASSVEVVTLATDATHYLTFVNADNGTGTQENLYTDAGIQYNPSSDILTVGEVVISGDLTVNGTQTIFDTTIIQAQDKNITLGVTTSPTDAGADGGGLTLKGTTDKTFNWVNATNAFTASEHINIAAGKEYRIGGVKVVDSTSLGSLVVDSSLTSVGDLTDLTVTGDITANGNITGDSLTDITGIRVMHSQFITIDNVNLNASATELNYLDGSTPGSATAGNAVVLDSSKDVTGINILQASSLVGALTGNADSSDQVKTVRVNTNAAHYLTFVDGDNTSQANEELNTSLLATFNPSDGSLVASKLTASSNFYLGLTEVTSTGTELNYLDGSTPGTATASNAVVLDGSLDISGINNIDITGDLVGDGTSNISGVTSVTASGKMFAQAFTISSDERLKENIEVIPAAVEKVEAIRGVTFDWKDGSGSTAGIIAQEVEAILPSVVVQGEYKAVDYNGLIGLLVEAVKELSAEVKELKANN